MDSSAPEADPKTLRLAVCPFGDSELDSERARFIRERGNRALVIVFSQGHF